jgi:hypothetical protein
MKVYIIGIFTALLLAGCVGKMDYTPPSKPIGTINQKIVDKPRESVWNTIVPELGKQFFVINNIDKSSGLINISYSGNPERYIDCGNITSYVKNARGERTYNFPASKAQQRFEVLDGNGLFGIDRQMILEGRVNLIFEEINPKQTRVSANTRYVVQKKSKVFNFANNMTYPYDDSISFNSNSSAFFPSDSKGHGTECLSNGKLEEEILALIKE